MLTYFRSAIQEFPREASNKEHSGDTKSDIHDERKDIFLIKQTFCSFKLLVFVISRILLE